MVGENILGLPLETLANPSSFDDRLKVEKAVFLLNHLRIVPFTAYSFNSYLRGPYSLGLTEDYYRLEEVQPEAVNIDTRPVPERPLLLFKVK